MNTPLRAFSPLLLIFLVLTVTGCSTPVRVAQSNTNSNSSTESDGIQFVKTIAVTPDDDYSFGAFCRVNYRPTQGDFFVSFGGSSPIAQHVESGFRAGGAEGGNAYYYKVYNEDFEYTGENGKLVNSGGDIASVFAEGYYFFLTGGPQGLRLRKIDPATWQEVDQVDIDVDEAHEATNDQMLAYANGQLVVSALYNAEASNGITDQKNIDPTTGGGTHNRIFTTDLKLVDYFILDDTPHINASSLVFLDGVYNYITSTAFFGDIIVMQYDEDWTYLGVKTLEPHGQWSQGAVYDPSSERFYVSYLDLGEIRNGKIKLGSRPNVVIGVFTKEWELVENISVTEFDENTTLHAGRPSLILQDNALYVSYDIENIDPRTGTESKDWQCEVSEFAL